MRFYDQQHPFYAGIDLHSRTMHLCVLDARGAVVYDKNLPCRPDAFLDAIAPFRPNVIIGAECMFGWYWLSDLCQKESLPFIIGHALYMKAIHGGKAKNDRIDANKIARLLRGGNFPLAYVYPKGMRETRDLLRRRNWFVRQRASLFTHLQILNSQYNLPPFPKKLAFAANREELDIARRFTDPSVQKNAAANLGVIDCLDTQIAELELYLTRTAKVDDVQTFHRLQSIPGVGKVLALVLLYEIHDIKRFPNVGTFLSPVEYDRHFMFPGLLVSSRIGQRRVRVKGVTQGQTNGCCCRRTGRKHRYHSDSGQAIAVRCWTPKRSFSRRLERSRHPGHHCEALDSSSTPTGPPSDRRYAAGPARDRSPRPTSRLLRLWKPLSSVTSTRPRRAALLSVPWNARGGAHHHHLHPAFRHAGQFQICGSGWRSRGR